MHSPTYILTVEESHDRGDGAVQWLSERFPTARILEASTLANAQALDEKESIDCVVLSARVEGFYTQVFRAPVVLLVDAADDIEDLPERFFHAVHRERSSDVETYLSIRAAMATACLRRELDESKQLLVGASRDAAVDVVTGLSTRDRFQARVSSAMKRDEAGALHGVLLVGLDGFKAINSSFGHDTGDALLKQVASRLSHCVRSADGIARWGSDEFAILLEDMPRTEDPVVVARRVIYALGRAFTGGEEDLYLTASVGIAVGPANGLEAETVLQHADAAMYRVKHAGGNDYQFYSEESDRGLAKRLVTESRLRVALKREEFFLVYQPQIDARDGTVVGVEALLRWNDPDNGVVSPLEFIPLLEETGLIVQVGEWVLRKACTQARAWQYAGLGHLQLSVNVSPRQFRQRALVDRVGVVLAETGFAPDRLELEVTESALMEDHRYAIEVLTNLRSLGAQIALDDFGTGYSSLVFLKDFPVNTLKIDRAFIRNIAESTEDRSICAAIVALAKALGLRVLAEGVEEPAQIEVLAEEGCHLVQGFLYARPMAADDLWTWLNTDIESRIAHPSAV